MEWNWTQGGKREIGKDGQRGEKAGVKEGIVLRRDKRVRERSKSGSSTKSLEELWWGEKKLGRRKGEKE